jgi:hypothetical protein
LSLNTTNVVSPLHDFTTAQFLYVIAITANKATFWLLQYKETFFTTAKMPPVRIPILPLPWIY